MRLALALIARGQDAWVVNADSAQVYADLRVLSARPSAEEMRGIRHELFGTWDGAQACSAADWATEAKRVIADAHQAGAVPVLVGGTGLYIRTLLDGIAPVPEIEPDVRAAVRALPLDTAYAELQLCDPKRAAKLSPADSQRITRALEVARSTGRTLGEWQEKREGGIANAISLAPLVLLPDREAIYSRCDSRFAKMMERGAIEEVEALLERQLLPDLPVMRAIGVPEITTYLRGESSRDEVIERAQQATRNYAKRQYTWLRHQPPSEWARNAPENVNLEVNFAILFPD